MVLLVLACHYVFMCFLPSFLRSWGPSVTRISGSSYRRLVARAPPEGLEWAGQPAPDKA